MEILKAIESVGRKEIRRQESANLTSKEKSKKQKKKM